MTPEEEDTDIAKSCSKELRSIAY